MINSVTIIENKTKKFYRCNFKEKNLIFSDKNNCGKTIILKSIMNALGNKDEMKKNDNLSIEKDLILIISINNKFYAKFNKKFYSFSNNENAKIEESKKYCKKIILDFIENKNVSNIFPPIKMKTGKWEENYFNCFWTFFYIDVDKSGKNENQLKNEMYGKVNLDNYFFSLWNGDYKVFEILNILKNSSFENEKNKQEISKNVLIELKKIFQKLSENKNEILFLDNSEIEKIKDNLNDLYKKNLQFKNKISNNNNLINHLQTISNSITEKNSFLFQKKITINVPITNEETLETREYTGEISLDSFFSEFVVNNVLTTNEISKKIKNIKDENIEIQKKIQKINYEIIENKENLNKNFSKKNFNILGEEFFEKAFSSKKEEIKKMEEEIKNKIAETKNSKKDFNEFIKASSRDFKIQFEEFANKNNWKGGTNSSKFSEMYFKYKLLHEKKEFEKIPFIVDALDSTGIDYEKLFLFLSGDNQKIFSLNSKKENKFYNFFEENKFNIIDLSDKNENLISENLENLKDIDLTAWKIYQEIKDEKKDE